MKKAEDFLREICPNHTDSSKWNKSELLTLLDKYLVLQLKQKVVMQQRELLFSFEKFKTDHILNATDEWRYANVDLFLSKQESTLQLTY